MILDKVDPLIIFKFAVDDPSFYDAYSQANGIPVVGSVLGDILLAAGGIPIPLYLSEQLSGIVIDSVSNSYDIDTSVEGINKATNLDISQRVIDSTTTVVMTCNNKDSLVLSAILAFMDLIIRKAVSRAYTISFISGSTILLDALLKSFNTSMNSDSELVTITMVLSKVNGKPDKVFTSIPNTVGTSPGIGSL